jgi:hypothetical protein
MADSHPFANAGLGMFGSAERQFASQGMNPQNNKNNLLGGGLASILKSLGVGQDTVDKLNLGGTQPGTAPPDLQKAPVIPPSSSYQPLTSQYGFGANPAQQSSQQTTPNSSSYFMEPNQNNLNKDLNFIDSFKIPRLGGL